MSLSPTNQYEIHVLYASQTGDSENAAREFASSISKKLSNETRIVIGRAMQQDDFLEIERAPFPSSRIVVIITSSYGVGQAPLGGYKFRELCDAILDKPDKQVNKMLHGLKYAMLGLGDSNYITFFENPLTLDSALTKAGAVRIGPLGKADRNGQGDDEQFKVMKDWTEGIWEPLNDVLSKEESMSKEDAKESMEKAQEHTCALCSDVLEDWINDTNGKRQNWIEIFSNLSKILIPIFIALLIRKLLLSKE